ncbi:50S ribosomal protein L21e [Candidatus Pacearchaeota archaeon]|nr:50S ribosomal protein L21e [Candidatus Pacearchaeota archaeon]
MLKQKRMRDRGKLSLTRFFQKFKPGDAVAVVREHAVPFGYSTRVHGRTGKVIAQRGSAYEVEVNDINKPKRYLIKPIHLKKITQ